MVMDIEFDPAKDAANIAKHGVSLALAADLEILAVVDDLRFAEQRWRAYGFIDGVAYCLAFTVRGQRVRAISLRRARAKEYRRHVP
jgi:uncharacterized DUF497 family protein